MSKKKKAKITPMAPATGAQETIPGTMLFPEKYDFLNEKLSGAWGYESEIGSGRNGIALKICDINTGRAYCLKTYKSQGGDAEVEHARESIIKEIRFLKNAEHRSIPPIYKYDDSENPFYITDFHRGKTLEQMRIDGDRVNWTDARIILFQIADGLRYLHEKRGIHCDLHTKNVMASKRTCEDGVLIIDYGSGHRFSDSEEITRNGGEVHYKDTTDVPAHRLEVTRASAIGMSGADYKAFGDIMKRLRDVFAGSLALESLSEYLILAKECVDVGSMSWPTIIDRLGRIDEPRQDTKRALQIIDNGTARKTKIAIPVTGNVRCTGEIIDIINTNPFQRLRRINQLSFCDWEYPGANHSRFEHSLGVMELATRAIESLSNYREFRLRYSSADLRSFIIASLLHDIGHYPFAHPVEQFAASRFPGDSEVKTAIHHADNGSAILDNDLEIGAVLNSICGPDGVRLVKSIWKSSDKILGHLIDGPMDLDKMDYLTRDAYHCGLRYGTNIDHGKMLDGHRICPDGGLGIDIDSLGDYEGFAILQDQMLTDVYWHSVSRANMAAFHTLLAVFFWSGAKGEMNRERFIKFIGKVKEARDEVDVIDRVIMGDLKNNISPEWARKYPGSEDHIRRYCESLVLNYYKPNFKNIMREIAAFRNNDEFNVSSSALLKLNVWSQLYKISDSRSIPTVNLDAMAALRSSFKTAIAKHVPLQSWENIKIAVDVPFGKSNHRSIQVVTKANVVQDITSVTHLQQSLFANPTAYNSPIRIYVSPDIYEKCKDYLEGIKIDAIKAFGKVAGDGF